MLDLVIPFYNPTFGWEQKFVHKFNTLIDNYFDGNKNFIHLIIVNDGSSQGFTNEAISFIKEHIANVTLLSYPENQGKGFALRKGVSASTAEYCIYTDSDFPFGLAAVRDIYNVLEHGADIVTGRRTDGNYFKHLPLKRKVMSKGIAFINRYLLRLRISDTQAGIKGFNQTGKAIFLKTTIDRFLFDMEFILIASKMANIKIQEQEVNLAQNTSMTNFSNKVIRQELTNLMRIILKRKGKES